MEFRVKKEKGTGISYLSLFLVSFFLSALGIILCGKEIIECSKVLDKNTLEVWNSEMGGTKELFFYIWKERIWVIPFLFLLATTYLAKVSGYVLILGYGVGFGIVTGIALLRYGIFGILLVTAAGMPHYLIYISVLIFAINVNRRQRTVNKKFYIQLLVLEALVLVGCLLESYINPVVLKKFINIF